MSHHQETKLKTQEMVEPTFRKAVELMAQHHGMSIKEGATQVKDMAGKLEKVDLVIHHPADQWEVGAKYNDGHPSLIGDTYNHGRSNNGKGMKTLEDWMDVYYTAVTTGESMVDSGQFNEMSYAFNSERQEVEIEGIKY